MLRVLQALAVSNDHIQLLRSAEEFNDARHKDEYESRLDILEALIRDAWMLALQAPSESVVNEDLLPELKKISQRLDGRRPADWISQIEELREQLIVNINRKSATDALFLHYGRRCPAARKKTIHSKITSHLDDYDPFRLRDGLPKNPAFNDASIIPFRTLRSISANLFM